MALYKQLALGAGLAALLSTAAHADLSGKVIGFSQGAVPLLAAAGVLPDADEGMLELRAGSAAEYVALCRRMRIWGREMAAGL